MTRIISYLPRWVEANFVEQLLVDYQLHGDEWLAKDLEIIKELGFNVIRIFIPYAGTDSRGPFCNEFSGAVKPVYLLNLLDITRKAAQKGLAISPVLFAWRDSSQTGWDKYSRDNQAKHLTYLSSVYETLFDEPNIAYVSLENELNFEPNSWWSGPDSNRDMTLDWLWRMSKVHRDTMAWRKKQTDLDPWPLGVGLSDVYPDFMNDPFRTPSWGGGSLLDQIDLILLHVYNPGFTGNAGVIDNTIYYWQVVKGVKKPIIVEELPSDNGWDLLAMLGQCERQKVDYGIWDLYARGYQGHGIVNLDGTIRYKDLFHREGEHDGPG